MIEKAVTYIVLDQNGITNFTDAFKYSVDQIIAGLQEIEQLREENIQLGAICDHQEKQMMEKRLVEAPLITNTAAILTSASNEFTKIDLGTIVTLDKLEKHKKYLDLILESIQSKPSQFDGKISAISTDDAQIVQRGESASTMVESRNSLASNNNPTASLKPPPPPPPRTFLNCF